MEFQNHTEKARTSLLQGIAAELVDLAADALQPCTQVPLCTDWRATLSADLYQALLKNMPPMTNLLHAMDLIPATA